MPPYALTTTQARKLLRLLRVYLYISSHSFNALCGSGLFFQRGQKITHCIEEQADKKWVDSGLGNVKGMIFFMQSFLTRLKQAVAFISSPNTTVYPFVFIRYAMRGLG
jgi:hypothetical protein